MGDITVRWAQRLDGETADAVRELLAAASAADGVAPVSEQAVLSLSEPGAARHLLAEHDGELAGYANLVPAHGDHPAMAEAAVAPARRGRGIGTALVREALAAGGADARVWAHGDRPAAKAVAARLGLRTARELWQMRRSLATPQLPELVVPDGIVLRTYAGPADDAELLRVNNAAFDWHPEQGGWTERDIAVRRAESWFDPAGLFLATDTAAPDRVLGFHWTKVHADQQPPVGEVYVVGIDPAAQGRGLGRLLTLAGLHHLRERGLGGVLLYTEADNTAAVNTYTKLGFAPAHVDVAYAANGA
ncbi:mycothiol synthase [Nocardia farcinica]|uniref:mycothiol synthase n=1 Tax=Nocardia farcinica TaxID=37329 RepID=UPI001894D725|nr:mycothiol synthase [Nocardia farcinica]MBF6262775.1 mycothiol synthase [Nocardia farcinica]MBF6281279.1 mycothiol synthase [Nocardia farcinica]MBF6305925.1 mycothiol synthase [Nocardia farcinica]MBF6389847.1 mycothiol synthase [Nocardia farcinica]MBF6492650.1 mycothiol synthase [Nocardia farcinica]